MTANHTDNRKLVPHDGFSETFVCRPCMEEWDGTQAETYVNAHPGYTMEDADNAVCPHCRGADTAWLFAEGQ